MIRTLLLVFALVVALQATNIDERYYESTARDLGIEKEDVRTCAITTNITAEDVQHLDEIMRGHLQITDLEDKDIKIGCFVACIFQKKGLMSGAHFNVDKVKEFINLSVMPEKITEVFQKANTCTDQVKNETKECEAAIKFTMCLNERNTTSRGGNIINEE